MGRPHSNWLLRIRLYIPRGATVRVDGARQRLAAAPEQRRYLAEHGGRGTVILDALLRKQCLHWREFQEIGTRGAPRVVTGC